MPQLRGYQQKIKSDIYAAWDSGAQNVLAVLPTGAGKCLAKGTPVLCLDGDVRPVEDIRVGQLLMGPDSQPRKVVSLSRGREMMYRITPVKGEPFVVNESHILSFKKTGSYEVVNLSVKDYLSKSRTWKHTHKAWRVGVDFPTKKHSKVLPPYMLGLWLGDGSAKSASVTTADVEIINYLYSFAEKTGQSLRMEELPIGNRASTYHLSKDYARDGTRSELRRLGLLFNKHVPMGYKTGDRSQRLELLAGLLDSDGHYDGKSYDVVFKIERLANDLAYVARSLGFAAYVKPCIKKCYNTGSSGAYFRISISGDFSDIPTRLTRNVFRARRQRKNVLLTGISVEPIGEDEYFGFTLSGPDRLFLLGDFTVTHNTVTFSDVIHDHDEPSCAIVHRQELVGQISTALARNGVRHRVIGPPKVTKMCVNLHMDELGRSYVDPNSWHAVAGVDTIIRRTTELETWSRSVRRWVGDEFHHFLRENKWGKALEMFPNARGLGVTATPCRADGKGLGRHADGVVDVMIDGPTMRELIDMGYLTDYRIFSPPSDYHRPNIVGTSGDYTRDGMRKAARGSHIVGDVVEHYLRIAPGKLGVTFVPDLDTAAEVAAQFNARGVPAAVVSGESSDEERTRLLRMFKNKQLMQLVNVDLFGEGFDLPAIEVVSFARPTESLSLYIQQFGRVLRLMLGAELHAIWESLSPAQRKAYIAASTKPHGIIIDHVGNVTRHRLPDATREWSLDRRDRRSSSSKDSGVPMWTCRQCSGSWEKIYKTCLGCGAPMPEPSARSGPEFVDGDLIELDPFVLEKMRGEIARVDMHPEAYRVELSAKYVPTIGQHAHVKRHVERQEAQRQLRDSLAWWGGYQRALGRDDSESYRRFYYQFGVDVLTAQTLNAKDATDLKTRVDSHLTGVIRT